MEEWKTYTASDFCIKVTDGTHDSPKPKGSGHYLITSKHLKDNCIDFSLAYRISEEDYQKIIKRSNVVQHDILFSMIGTIGNIVRITAPIVDFAVKNMAIFKMGGNELKSKWLYYWLQSPSAKEYIASRLAGSTQAYLTLDSIRQYPISSPSEVEMKRIVDILQSIDDKIELNNRINHNLEEQAQALYKSWFVDFEPFKGGKFVDSELGLIPEGWSTISFRDFLTPISRKVPVGLYPEYSVTNTGIIPRSERFKKQLSGNTSQNKELRKFDIVFGMSREILNWGIMLEDVGSVSSAYSIYEINKTMIHPLYLKYYMEQRSRYFNDLIGTAAREGQSLDKGALMQKFATVPPSSILLSFMERDNVYRKQIIALESENKYLESIRDAILPKLMSGELKINDLTC